MASVPGFLTKTFEIFSSPEYSDCCGWGANGDTIVIKKIEQFAKEVVPKFFKHSNFQSFVRQLNMYDFHKTVQDPSHGEFAHEFFKRGKPELLIHIKRKANKTPIPAATTKPKTGKNSSNGGSSSSTRGNNSSSNAASGTAASSSSTSNTSKGNGKAATNTPNITSTQNIVNSVPPLPVSEIYPLPLPDPLYSAQITDLDGDGLGYLVDEVGSVYPIPTTTGTAGATGPSMSSGQYSDPGNYSPPLLPEELAAETDHVLMELNQQRALRESFERRMEQRLAALQGENNMLKRMFMESHHKNAVMQERMERVMKTLYNMFVVGGGNAPGLALTNRAPSLLLTDIQNFEKQKNGDSVVEQLGGDTNGRIVGTGRSPFSTFLDRTRSTDTAGLSRLDSATLERLPSLDLADLDTLTAAPAQPVPLNDAGANSAENVPFAHLLRRPGAGAPLDSESRVNSFDLAASTVTAPSSSSLLHRQGSFDTSYLLPIPVDGPSAVSDAPSAPTGRVYLQPGGIASGENAGSSRSAAGADGLPPRPQSSWEGASSSGSALKGSAGSGPVPLMRQRTFDSATSSTSDHSASSNGEFKRKLSGGTALGGGEPLDKKVRMATDLDQEAELQRLQSEDMASSLSEAHEFMNLLNRNQQNTLTRLDSLEMTIASLFEGGSNNTDSSQGGAAGASQSAELKLSPTPPPPPAGEAKA